MQRISVNLFGLDMKQLGDSFLRSSWNLADLWLKSELKLEKKGSKNSIKP